VLQIFKAFSTIFNF